MNEQTTKTLDENKRYDRIHAGDAGIDLVSFLRLDFASYIPFALGQCTCSYDEWIDKQISINLDTWHARMEPLAPFWQFMYVPFSCHNVLNRFEQASEIHTCLIDRQRILHILKSHDYLIHEMESFNLNELIKEIWQS